jgi:predicted phosphodiesterase
VLYRVRSGSSISPVFTTATAPPAGPHSFRMGWIADNQDQGGTPFAGVLAGLALHDVTWIAHAGDSVQHGDVVQEWHDDWYVPLAGTGGLGQRVPILIGRGNHDGESATAYAYHWLPGNGSWYAMTVGPVRFVFLDSNLITTTAQTDWLAEELASPAAQSAPFRIAVFHTPPYTNLWDNGAGYNGEPLVRALWVPLFEQFHVDLVVSGHAHAYQRGDRNGVRYMTVGGAGGALDTVVPPVTWDHIEVALPVHHFAVLEAQAHRLVWTAYDLNDTVIDAFEIDAATPVPTGELPWWATAVALVVAAFAVSRQARRARRGPLFR